VNNQIEIRPEGAIVCWRTASGNRAVIKEALDKLGFGKLLPSRETPLAAGKRAMARWARLNNWRGDSRTEVLVRGSKGGVSIVAERKADTEDVAAKSINDYGTVSKLALGKKGLLTSYAEALCFDGGTLGGGKLGAWTAVPGELQQIYDDERNTVSAHALGWTIKEVLVRLNAVRVRPEGGVVWVPESEVPKVEALRDAIVKAAPGAAVYVIRTVMDTAALACIGDALKSEVEQIDSEINRYLDEERDPPPRYTEKVKAAQEKVDAYEKALKAQFGVVTGLAEKTEEKLTQSSFMDTVANALA
tara:strand:+ start:368 stop:1276 length:909 start_codon:yes stop_codon:yes gene_type:complete